MTEHCESCNCENCQKQNKTRFRRQQYIQRNTPPPQMELNYLSNIYESGGMGQSGQSLNMISNAGCNRSNSLSNSLYNYNTQFNSVNNNKQKLSTQTYNNRWWSDECGLRWWWVLFFMLVVPAIIVLFIYLGYKFYLWYTERTKRKKIDAQEEAALRQDEATIEVKKTIAQEEAALRQDEATIDAQEEAALRQDEATIEVKKTVEQQEREESKTGESTEEYTPPPPKRRKPPPPRLGGRPVSEYKNRPLPPKRRKPPPKRMKPPPPPH